MKLKKVVAAALTAAMVFNLAGFTSLAVVSKDISSVNLTIEADIQLEGYINDQEVDITAKGDKFTVGEYEFLNDGIYWTEDDTPELKVTLYAEEGYRFSIKNDGIKLKGATYISKKTEDVSKTLYITMYLPPLSERTSAIETASWTSTTGVSWTESLGAGSYEVKLYRDGKSVGTSKTVTGTTFDFSYAMTKAGNYYYRVRPINRLKADNKGEWVESATKYIDADTANQIRLNPAASGEWKVSEAGWWYQNSDGTYPVSQWQEINGKWYFFNDQGYMATGWVDWNGAKYYCDTVNGDMLVNTVTPDGHTVGTDGALIQ